MKCIYNKIWLLLVLFLACACNDKGDVTVVIEDGQPAIRTMVVGKWQPKQRSWIDKLTGEVKKSYDMENNNEENSIWEFFEDGTFGFSNGNSSTGSRFDWNTDEEDYTIYLDGEEWTVGQLTEYMMRLYREGKKSDTGYDPNSWLAYDFERIGDYVSEDEPGNEPQGSTSYRIASITETKESKWSDRIDKKVYTYDYDNKGRISEWAIDGKTVAAYVYDDEEGRVMVSSDGNYIGSLNGDGYISSIQKRSTNASSNEWKTVVSSTYYDSNKQLIQIQSNKFSYKEGERIAVGDDYTYSYSDIVNQTIPDLNCIISDNYSGEPYYSSYSLFSPFGMYGVSSKHLISKEQTPASHDLYSTYEYELDKEKRVSRVIQSNISQVGIDAGETSGTIVYDITYTD